MKKYKLYRSSGYEVLEVSGKYCIILDLKNEKYYRKGVPFAELSIPFDTMKYFRLTFLDIVVFFLLIFLPYLLYYVFDAMANYDWIQAEISIMTLIGGILILIINIFLHEFSHWIVLKFYTKKKIDFGLRIESCSIKLFTDTSPSYMLPKYKRFIVYSIGIITNIYIMYMVARFTELSLYTLAFVFVFTIMNIIPSKSANNDVMNIIRLIREEI